MKKHHSIIAVAVWFGFMTCNNPGGPATTSVDHTAVTVALIAKTQAQSIYKITITGSGMETIGPNEYAGGQTIELYVPVGKARTFHFERYNTGGILIDTGTTISDIGTGMNNAVSVSLAAAIALPTITIHPAAQSAVEGTTATFTITANGTDVKYQWQKGTANINGATSVAYTTSELSLSDAAAYRCVVSNPTGSITSSEAVLSVTAAIIAPAIMTQPSDQTITAGQVATFTIAATGSDLKFQWQKGTVNIVGAVYPVYSTPIVSAADSGSTFRCVVVNSIGNKESNLAMLRVTTIITAPSITVHPTDQTVTEGQNAAFSIVATGTNLKYQWQKGGLDISGATSPTLTLPVTTLADNGAVFRCNVSNSAGNQPSSAGTLSVKQAIIAPSIIIHPEDQSITEGQAATFTIGATGTNLQFQWQKGTTDILGATGSSYTTGTNPISENNSIFRCVVKNTGGSLTSNPARLTIVQKVVAPSINIHPSDKTVMEGQTAFFSVMALGTNLKFQWQKGTTDIPDATTSSYTTPPANYNDNNATFRCVVSNSAGTLRSNSATLVITLKPPSIISQPVSNTVAKGETASFTVTATGTDLKYQWQKGTTDISGATSQTYTTPAATISDSGSTYRCLVSNSTGNKISSAATLSVVAFIFKLPFVVDNFSDGNDLNILGLNWYYYDDNVGVGPNDRPQIAPTLKPTIVNVPFTEAPRHAFGDATDTWIVKTYAFQTITHLSKPCAIMPFTFGDAWEARYCAKGLACALPFVGLSTMLAKDGASMDLTGAKTIKFFAKSRVNDLTEVRFKIETLDINIFSNKPGSEMTGKEFGYFCAPISVLKGDWQPFEITIADLQIPTWAKEFAFDIKNCTRLTWEVTGKRVITVDTLDIADVIIR